MTRTTRQRDSNRYRTKDDLLEDAVAILLTRRFSDDLAANSHTFADADPGSATARVVGGYLSAPGTSGIDWRLVLGPLVTPRSSG